ncbi:hypothetical protein QBC40DRAFT_287780, partial [Triangularia verruculosa]
MGTRTKRSRGWDLRKKRLVLQHWTVMICFFFSTTIALLFTDGNMKDGSRRFCLAFSCLVYTTIMKLAFYKGIS